MARRQGSPAARVLAEFQRGRVSLETAVEELLLCSRDGFDFAHLDHDRARRCGYPEVVLGQGKSPAEVEALAARIYERAGRVLVTRADDETRSRLLRRFPAAHVNARARLVRLGPVLRPVGRVAVVSAGTADLPVADEAAETATALGSRVERVVDVGVAGLHRLLARTPSLRRARVAVVVAGMEGALPSVVAGLLDRPVIAVPTSVGYGASFGGIAALLAMLNACAAGVTVVNIDNGFGAGYAAHLVNTAGRAATRRAGAGVAGAGRAPARNGRRGR